MATALPDHAPDPFRHEALLYAGDDEFAARVGEFVAEGVALDEPVLVVVARRKIGLLLDQLGDLADAVTFTDMAAVGANPARIIPAWHRFVDGRPRGARFRGVGEPIDAGRTPAQLVECQRHEALLNLAFAGSGDWSLLCPYDTAALAPEVVDEALRTHPYVHDSGTSPAYRDDSDGLPEHPLSPPPEARAELHYGVGPLDPVHDFVRRHAAAAGLSPARVDDLDIAVHELAINTARHTRSGRGAVLFWTEGDHVVCEVHDDGRIDNPLVGRTPPTTEQEGGRGVWIVHELCDLVQIRSTRSGTVVRVWVSRG